MTKVVYLKHLLQADKLPSEDTPELQLYDTQQNKSQPRTLGSSNLGLSLVHFTTLRKDSRDFGPHDARTGERKYMLSQPKIEA